MITAKRTLLGWTLALSSLAASLAAHADCQLPPAPSKIPDGSHANQQEMLNAMQTLKEYSADVDTYMKCLDFEARQNHLSRAEEAQMHNEAFDALQKIAQKFNEQVRTFKAKSG
jgi:hypothetical protein